LSERQTLFDRIQQNKPSELDIFIPIEFMDDPLILKAAEHSRWLWNLPVPVKPLEKLSKLSSKDKNGFMEAVAINPYILLHASRELRNDRQLVMVAVNKLGRCIQFASEDMKESPKVVQAALKNDLQAIFYVDRSLRTREFITKTAKLYTRNVVFTAQQVQNEKQDLLDKLEKHPFSMLKLFDLICNDHDFILEILDRNPLCFLLFPEESVTSQMATRAVEKNGLLFQFVPDELKDIDMAISAIKKHPQCINYFTPELKKNRQVMEEAVKKRLGLSSLFKDASEELKKDCEFIIHSLQFYPSDVWNEIDSSLKQELMLKFAEFGCRKVWENKSLSQQYRDNEELVMKALSHNNTIFEFVSPRLKNCKQVVLEAVRKNSLYTFMHASEEMRNDRQVILEALKSGVILNDVSIELSNQDYLEFIKVNPEVALQAPGDRIEMIKEGIKTHGSFLKKVCDLDFPFETKQLHELQELAVQQNGFFDALFVTTDQHLNRLKELGFTSRFSD